MAVNALLHYLLTYLLLFIPFIYLLIYLRIQSLPLNSVRISDYTDPVTGRKDDLWITDWEGNGRSLI